MSKMSQLHAQLSEHGMLTERQITEQIQEKMDQTMMEIKTPKLIVYKGIVTAIVAIPNKFANSFNYRIEMDKQNFYYNAKSEHTVHRLFTVNSIAAFTCVPKPNKQGKVYQIIENVLYTF